MARPVLNPAYFLVFGLRGAAGLKEYFNARFGRLWRFLLNGVSVTMTFRHRVIRTEVSIEDLPLCYDLCIITDTYPVILAGWAI